MEVTPHHSRFGVLTMEETFTGTVKGLYSSKSYVIATGKSPRNIQLNTLLKKFNGKQVKGSNENIDVEGINHVSYEL